MKTIVAALLSGIAGVLLTLAAVHWLRGHETPENVAAGRSPKSGEPADEAHPHEESRVHRGTNGEVTLQIDLATQQRMGLKIATVTNRLQPAEFRAYGRILDSAPLAQAVTEVAGLQAAVSTSRKEAERARTLFAQNQNASARSVEVAQSTLQRDEIAQEAAQFRLLTLAGSAVAGRDDLTALAGRLIRQQAALARLDLPVNSGPDQAPIAAHVRWAGSDTVTTEARYLGPAPATEVQFQGRGYLFLVETNPPAPGSALTAWLEFPGVPPETQVLVPRSALLRHGGEVFVEVKTRNDTFTRRPVELDHAVNDGWLIRSGINPGDQVVIAGAQEIFSEEIKGPAGGD